MNARKGLFRKSPDMVLFPESHEDVEDIVSLCNKYSVTVIPFGGGTNIVGGVDSFDIKNQVYSCKTIATFSLARMNKLLSLDPISHTANIEAGSSGPKLEEDLQAKGWSLGHYPDSFEHSTIQCLQERFQNECNGWDMLAAISLIPIKQAHAYSLLMQHLKPLKKN